MAIADVHSPDTRRERPRTLEEFLGWHDEDAWVEWAGGEVVTLSPASNRHQQITRLLSALLSLYVEEHDVGWVATAPFLMHLPHLDRAREPDLLFVAREHLERVRETRLEGAADLVVEILSPESVSRDRGDKFVEYEAAGVREYWLIDPDRRQVEVYGLDDVGGERRFRLRPADAAGRHRSQVLAGFWLHPDWLFDEPIKVTDAARELGLLD